MQKNIKKTRTKSLIHFCIFIIILSTIFTFNITTSRYLETIVSNNDIIAVPALTLSNNNETITIENEIYPGDTFTHDFSVSNVDNETNEVLLSYYFNISVQTTIPLRLELYNKTNGEAITIAEDGTTGNIEMGYDEPITHEYTLNIIWDAEYNDPVYAGQEITCTIKLEAVQVVEGA